MVSISIKNTIFKYIIFVIVLFNSIEIITTQSPLKQLHILFRHGERTPTETYKNDPHRNFSWSGGWGQLTNRGKFEMYSLGLKIRELYSDFIPDLYFPKDVKIASSYADRCLMSAQTLLAALFPPKKEQIWNPELLWQPIPVHYVPRSQDNLIAMKAQCKKYDQELASLSKSETIHSINMNNSKLFEFLTEHTGQQISDIGSVELLYNTLEIEMLHNLTLPVWVENVSLDYLKSLAARSLETFTETDYMKKMKGGVFLKEVISSMKNPEGSPFIYLYSAHDITLVNILKTLGYEAMLKPGFGASLTIELHNSSEVMMSYRDDVDSQPERITVKNCTEACLLDDLTAALEQFIPSYWEQECEV